MMTHMFRGRAGWLFWAGECPKAAKPMRGHSGDLLQPCRKLAAPPAAPAHHLAAGPDRLDLPACNMSTTPAATPYSAGHAAAHTPGAAAATAEGRSCGSGAKSTTLRAITLNAAPPLPLRRRSCLGRMPPRSGSQAWPRIALGGSTAPPAHSCTSGGSSQGRMRPTQILRGHRYQTWWQALQFGLGWLGLGGVARRGASSHEGRLAGLQAAGRAAAVTTPSRPPRRGPH
jgi:hypothetical protein